MPRLHSTLVALVLGAATTAGLFAAFQTVRLGQSASVRAKPSPVSARSIAVRQAKLARWSKSLREARAKQPPALPKLPKLAPVQIPQAATAAVAASAPMPAASTVQRTYSRPKPVVTYQRASTPATTTSSQPSWSDDSESSGSGESDDSGQQSQEGSGDDHGGD